MNRPMSHITIAAGLLAFVAATGFVYMASNKVKREIPLAGEKALKVNLSAGFGDLYISKGVSSNLIEAAISSELPGNLADYLDYSKRDDIGYLNINTSDALASSDREHGHNIHISGWKENTWSLHFSDAVPISFDLELGMGKGDIDLSGLAVKDLNLSTGASSVDLHFDRPNKSSMENLRIETGLSRFRGDGLCNARFHRFKFEGGVGSYVLDFSGQLNHEADVDIEVGLGSLTVVVPEGAGVKIYYEKSIVSHIDLPGDFDEREDNTYYSENYNSAKGRLNMHIEAGLGGVKVRRE